MSFAYIAVSFAVIGAATSVYGATEQNKAVKKSVKKAQAAGKVQQKQLQDQADLERRKLRNEAERVRGSLRVIGAESGFEQSGSYDALETQANIDEAINGIVLRKNLQNEQAAAASNLAVQLDNIVQRGQNVLLAGITGGIQGAQVGLQIGGAFGGGGEAVPAPDTNNAIKSPDGIEMP